MLLRLVRHLVAIYLRLLGARRHVLEAGAVSLVYYSIGPAGGGARGGGPRGGAVRGLLEPGDAAAAPRLPAAGARAVGPRRHAVRRRRARHPGGGRGPEGADRP